MYCFGLRLDDDMARIDDRRMGNDAVRHAVRGYVRCVVTDVGELGGGLRLVVTKYQSGSGRGGGDAVNDLGVRIDNSLREAVGLGSAIAHDPGFTG